MFKGEYNFQDELAIKRFIKEGFDELS